MFALQHFLDIKYKIIIIFISFNDKAKNLLDVVLHTYIHA